MTSLTHSRDSKQLGMLTTLGRDIVVVGTLGIILIIVHYSAQPFVRGFYCNDETIRYPYHESTVPSNVCYFVGSGINILLILILEYKNLLDASTKASSTSNSREASREPFPMGLYIKNVYCRLLVWGFGAISSELITDISKVTAGRLRPHFVDVCKPKIRVDKVDLGYEEYCKQDSSRFEYITNYYCSGGNPKGLRDARLSFMSGHSSYSSYSAAHAVFYLQSAMEVSQFGLIKPALQVLIGSTAFYTGLTRVSDYKHHWQDVLVGLSQGTTVAALVCFCVWPSLSKLYARFLKSSGTGRTGVQDSGEELNPVSY